MTRALIAAVVWLFANRLTFVIAAATNSTGNVTSVGSDDESRTSSSLVGLAVCEQILTECIAEDSVCSECHMAIVGREANHTECTETYFIDGQPAEHITCNTYTADICCRSQVSDEDCLANEAMARYWECNLDYYGCSIEEAISCDGYPVTATGEESSALRATGADAARLLRLGLAVVTAFALITFGVGI